MSVELDYRRVKDPSALLMAALADGGDFEGELRRAVGEAEVVEAILEPSTPQDFKPRMVADLFLAEGPAPSGYGLGAESRGWTLRLHRGKWFRFDGRVFIECPTEELSARVAAFIRSRKWMLEKRGEAYEVPGDATAATLRNVLANLSGGTDVPMPSEVDLPVWRDGGRADRSLVLRNGILDLNRWFRDRDDAMRPHTPDLVTLNLLPYNYDPLARCPRWEAFLEEVLPDVELRETLAEWFGYCLVPTQAYQRFAVLQGEGSNGKSVTVGILRRLIGEKNCSSVPLEMLHLPHSMEPLVGALLNVATEWSNVDAGGIAALKRISGGDVIHVNPKGTKGYDALLPTRFVVVVNDPPVVPDRAPAIWRRMMIFPFAVEIPLERRRPFELFLDELSSELPGILIWALEGLRRLVERGRFEEPAAMLLRKVAMIASSNPAVAWCEDFLTWEDVHPTRDWVTCDGAYQHYRDYCEKAGRGALSKSHFSQEVDRFLRQRRGQGLERTPSGGLPMRSSAKGKTRVYLGVTVEELEAV